MAKKVQPRKFEHGLSATSETVKHESNAFLSFVTGTHARWLYLLIYFCVTVFLFRDFLFNDVMLFGNDTIPDGIYTRQYYRNYHAEYGGIPRWNPFILGGLPFIDAMHGDTFYPAAWLNFFIPLKRALGHKLVWNVFLAGVFMYLFLRTLRLRKEAAFLGGFMYMLAPSFVSWLYGGHDAKMYVIALMPLAFTFLEAAMRSGKFPLFVCLGGVMGLLILTSQVQMAYYTYWAIGLYFLYRLFAGSENQILKTKRIVLFLMAVVIALALGAVQLIPSYKFTKSQSVRSGEERTGYEYATSFAMNFEEAAGMIVPSFPGFIDGRLESHQNLYWGKNPLKLNTEYHGIIPLLLGLMALLFCREKHKWFFLGIALLSFIYCLGANTPVYRLFYAFVPGIKNFRAPGMMIFIFCFAAVVLASQFLSVLFEKKVEMGHRKKFVMYSICIIAVITVLASIAGKNIFLLWRSIFFRGMSDYNTQAMTANVPFFIRDLWMVAILAGISLAGIWMFIVHKIGPLALALLLAIVVFIDDSVVDRRFITVFDPDTFESTAKDRTVRELEKKLSESGMPFRILGIVSRKSPNYYAMFGIQTADGFHNNELKTYERFKGGRQYRNFTDLWITENKFDPGGVMQNNFLKVAGVRYIVLPTREEGTQLFENKSSLERAFIVHERVMVHDDTLAVAMLRDTSFNPARTVIITGGTSGSYNGSDSLSVVDSFAYTKNGMAVKADFSSPGFLVVTENWVPYWKALVDGKPVDVKKAYGTFMAVECSQGKHEIQFTFTSLPYEQGKKLTLTSLSFVVFALAGSWLSVLIKRKRAAA
jgi:hypothetical protein